MRDRFITWGIVAAVILIVGIFTVVLILDLDAQKKCRRKGGSVVYDKSKPHITTHCTRSGVGTTCHTTTSYPWNCVMPEVKERP